MNLAADVATFLNGLDGLSMPALDALVKVTVVLGAAALATLVLGRASAAVRHLVWTLALTSALVLPVLSVALPRWQLPLVTLTSGAAPMPVEAPAPAQPASPRTRARITGQPATAASAPVQAASAVAAMPVAASTPRISLTLALVSIWALGLLAVVSRLLVGLAAVQWATRRTVRVNAASWLPLAEELASALGITRRVAFLESARATMPMAAGIFTPVVLMPEDANRWPIERLRIVLLHELAHVRRRDCLTHVVAQLACALHWFNPLAWMAARRIRTERERACDDLVLACGTRGPDYAEELLHIARDMSGARYPVLLAGATLAMAHRSQLEGRLIAILDPKVPRSGVSRSRAAVAAAVVAGALPPLAAMQPWAVTAVEVAPVSITSGAAPAAPIGQGTPKPAPRPEPDGGHDVDVDHARHTVDIGPIIAGALNDSAVHEAGERAHAAVQGAVHGAIQGTIHGGLQGVVQGAIDGAVHGIELGLELGLGPVEQGAKATTADPRMVAALTAALKDSDKQVRESALHALVRLRDPAVFEPLTQALKDASADVREQAAHGLSQLRDRRAVDPLVAALEDQSASVREAVVHALSQLRDPRTVEPLIAALADESQSVREQVAFALGQLRDARAVDPLVAALTDVNGDVREQVVFALGQLRDKRAASALAGLMKDPDADVREKAVFALGQMRDPSAIDGLVAALRDAKPDVREQAAFALGQIRDARAVPPLMSSLKDESASVREQAAFALGQIRDRAAVEALVLAMKDSSADVREQVAFALGQLRDPRAIEALTNALKDASADVRQRAAFALGQVAR
jgi:HEAT repeat protein/beta-lactamase regulating signal transducer with metallopeptidase domain